jgi:outer membrane protein
MIPKGESARLGSEEGRMNKTNSVAGRVFLFVTLALAIAAPLRRATGQEAPATPEAKPSVELVQPWAQAAPGQSQAGQSSATESAPPVTITLRDALDRARKNDPQYLAALGDARIAREDSIQARAAMLPTVSDASAFLNTQGTGVPGVAEGRFVTNDGVHVYRQWAVLHEDLSPNTYLLGGVHRAAVGEAIAKAKSEIARRGLTVTVNKTYYALAAAERKYATAQQAFDQTQQFFKRTQDIERAGQAAHSDVVKAEIQYRQQEQAFEEARLAMENARLDLAVLLFPTLNENFTIVDDMDSPQPLPPFPEVQALAGRENPEVRLATESMRQATLDVSAAKSAFLPSLAIDADYGIESNHFAVHSVWATHPETGPIPSLGYFLTASMTFPIWDWGTLRSKVRQTELRQEQARASLSQTQRQLLSQLYASYNEANVARSAVESSRHTADLAAESLRLVHLRYQGGESTALEVVDAQSTLTSTRNAYADSELRYRVALATLQTLTGTF